VRFTNKLLLRSAKELSLLLKTLDVRVGILFFFFFRKRKGKESINYVIIKT